MSENLLAISPINDDQVHLLTDLDVNVFTPKELDQKKYHRLILQLCMDGNRILAASC